MEGRPFRNSPVGCFSEGACLPRWRVTRRSIRAGYWYFSQKAVTSSTLTELKASVMGCKEGEPAPLQRSESGGALFAVMVKILLHTGAIAVQTVSELRIYPRLQSFWRALAQCRGTNYLGARNLSRCRI